MAMTQTNLKKLSTVKLRNRLDTIRSYMLSWTDSSPEERDANEVEFDEIKAILATREHYPRGKKGRQYRQKLKQNR